MTARAASVGAQGSELEISVVEREVSAEQIDEAVRELKGVCRISGIAFALRVGTVIIHHFYQGDTNAWRRRGPKTTSFRRLARHPDLPLSAGGLYRCVAVFELCDRLGAESKWRRLGVSHFTAVLGLPCARQEELLERANEQRWSVEYLRAQARALRAGRQSGGRLPQCSLLKGARALDQSLRRYEVALEKIGEDESDELERSFQVLTRTQASLDALVHEIRARCAG